MSVCVAVGAEDGERARVERSGAARREACECGMVRLVSSFQWVAVKVGDLRVSLTRV